MKNKRFYRGLYVLLGLLSVTLLGLNFAQLRWSGIFTGLMMFPYQPIGYGLRRLSLLGGLWDGLAWAVYLALGALALLPLAVRLKRRRKPGSGWMGVPVSFLTFITLYYMVNPGLVQGYQGFTLAGTTDSLLAAWLTLWAVERLDKASDRVRLEGLKWLLGVLDAVLILSVFGSAPGEYLAAVKAVAQANTALSTEELALTNGFLLGKTMVENLPLLLDVLLVHRVLRLAEIAGEDPFGEGAASAALRLSSAAKSVVLIQAGVQTAFHLAQLIASPGLCSTAVSVNLPLFSILFGVSAMVLARWMAQGRDIRSENDSFI